MKAEQIVRRTIQDHDLISPGDTVILGLSGGPDSLCLLHILTELRNELGFSLSCVHVNHLMRGETATEDAAWLTSHCDSLAVPLTICSCDVRALAKKENISVEEAGRRARHQALFKEAVDIKLQKRSNVCIAFAHNKDDQAETVLMRLLRGTGIHGLSAMEYMRPDGVIRPLLDTPRKDIEEYCAFYNLSPRWDCTNASKEFTRNRLRLDLIPLLEREYNPNLKDTLARLSDNAREDDAFLEKLVKEKLSEKVALFKSAGDDADNIAYSTADLASLDPALGKRLIKSIFSRLGLVEDIGHSHLNSLWAALQDASHGTVIEFPQGYKAEMSYDKTVFCRPKDLKVQDLNGGKRFVLSQTLLPRSTIEDIMALPSGQKALDADKVKSINAPIVLRTRLPGDYIQPLGFPGTKKLQDYFVDAKVEKRVRDNVPLVCAGSEILWIFNGPVNERFKVTEDTETVILLDIHQEIC